MSSPGRNRVHTLAVLSLCAHPRAGPVERRKEKIAGLCCCAAMEWAHASPASQFLCALSQLFSVLQVPTPVRERGETSDFKAKETVSRKKYLPDIIVRRY